VIDHDDIRRRIKGRFDDLGLPPTGKWLKDHGIGQTTIRNFLDGLSASLTVETVGKLAGPLKTTERWLLFGTSTDDLSEDVLRAMAEDAVSEIQPGMKIGQIRSAVASSLHEQLKLRQVVAGVQSKAADESVHNKGVQSRAPTTQSDQATLHNT